MGISMHTCKEKTFSIAFGPAIEQARYVAVSKRTAVNTSSGWRGKMGEVGVVRLLDLTKVFMFRFINSVAEVIWPP